MQKKEKKIIGGGYRLAQISQNGYNIDIKFKSEESEIMTTFSERMTAARKDKKLTQDQVAQALSVSRQLVSHWENGRVEPTQEQREAI